MSKIETNVVKPEIKFFENDSEQVIINSEFENKLDSKVSEMENYMKSNSGKDKSEDEKDALYKSSQEMYKEYVDLLRNTKYNFHLNRPQFKFLTDLILSKLEYDVNTVFFAIELTDMMGNMRNLKYSNDLELIAIPVNATEITYIYHLISKHKVKGLTKDAYLFSQILKRIGSISKIFNYYDAHAKSMTGDIQDWVASFEDGVTVEKFKQEVSEEVAEAVVTKPSKKK
jgi:hypothetical protein